MVRSLSGRLFSPCKPQPKRRFNTKEQLTKLLYNGSPEQRGKDRIPVVKLFTPDAGFTWLLMDIDPEEVDIAFGLCDLGLGFPELGNVSISELTSIRGHFGLPVERDLYFEGKHPINIYAQAASRKEHITYDEQLLQQIVASKKKG